MPSVPAGEASEAGRLFEEYSERIYGYCLRVLRARADAEDAVQTTFLYAHRALQRGIVPESEYAWLHSIATNVCRWQQRTVARRGRLSSDVDLDALPGSSAGNGDERDLLLQLEDALASLPEGQRRALLLREWQGLSPSEIASRLGLSTTATYALLTRARRSLARALTTAPRRPLLGVDFGSWLLKLKGLFAGAGAKAVATAVAVGSVAAGGAAVEMTMGQRPSTQLDPATTRAPVLDAPAHARSIARPAHQSAGRRTARAPARNRSAQVDSALPKTTKSATVSTSRESAAIRPPALDDPAFGAGPDVPAAGTSPKASDSPDPAPAPTSPPEDTSDPLPLPEPELPPVVDDVVPPLPPVETGDPLDEPVPELPPVEVPPAPPLPDPGLPQLP